MLSSFEHGAYNATCDRCGWAFKNRQLRLEPKTKLRVCSRCYDPFPLQEKPLRVRERGPLPWTRPEAEPEWAPSVAWLSPDGRFWNVYQDGTMALSVAPLSSFMGRAIAEAYLTDSAGTTWRLYVDDDGVPTTEAAAPSVTGQPYLPLSRDSIVVWLTVGTNGEWILTDAPMEGSDAIPVFVDPFA